MTFCLASILAFYLSSFQAFYLASILAFFLTHISCDLSGIPLHEFGPRPAPQPPGARDMAVGSKPTPQPPELEILSNMVFGSRHIPQRQRGGGGDEGGKEGEGRKAEGKREGRKEMHLC